MTLSRKAKKEHYATLDQKKDKKFWKTVKFLEKKASSLAGYSPFSILSVTLIDDGDKTRLP